MFNYKYQLKKRMLLATFLVAIAAHSNAQQEQVKGATQNESGEFLSGVSIKATHQGTDQHFTTSSSNNGLFNFRNLPLGGPYQFIFSSVGYKTDTLSGYQIQQNQTIALSVKLQQLTTTIEE
ncbi:MAG: carboxypeptidase-like regulatory domain-containing protein, partial [Sphingobacterium sp.]